MADFRHEENPYDVAFLGAGHASHLARPGESLTHDLLDAGEALLAAVDEGVISADEAARIFEHLHQELAIAMT